MPAPSAASAPRGRRPGATRTREEVLDAARTRFAADGYAAATVRRIAADAGVDAALVIRLYGSKDELFAAALSIPPGAVTRVTDAFAGPPETIGERVVRAYLSMWEDDPRDAEPLMAMFRSAVTNERAAVQLREFIQARLLEGIGPLLGTGEEAVLRAGVASSMLIGIVVGRRVVAVPALAGADREDLVRLAAPAIQGILWPS